MAKSESCSVENLLDRLAGTWTTYILWFLHKDGALRFGELGITVPKREKCTLRDSRSSEPDTKDR